MDQATDLELRGQSPPIAIKLSSRPTDPHIQPISHIQPPLPLQIPPPRIQKHQLTRRPLNPEPPLMNTAVARAA